jgi:hypothetical protein
VAPTIGGAGLWDRRPGLFASPSGRAPRRLAGLGSGAPLAFPSMILAHAGMDHILLFVVPVALAVLAMRLVEKRARERADGADSDSPEDVAAP